MRVVSEAWPDAVLSSQGLAVEVSVVATGEVLPVVDGSVTLDLTAAMRGRADLTFQGTDIAPVDPSSTLAPYGKELQVKRGLTYPDGTEELTSLGIFRVEETTVTTDVSEATTVQVTALDRSVVVSDAKFEAQTTITGGTNLITAVVDTIVAVYPGTLETNVPTTTHTLPTTKAEEGEDRWQFCQDICAAIGMWLYFDNDGVLVIRPIVSAEGALPQAYIVEGGDDVTVKPSLLTAGKRWSRTDTYNRWIVTGDNPDEAGAPPTATVTDDDPASPTYYYGPFGPKPEWWPSPFIVTDDMASDAAHGRKAEQTGTTQVIDFGSIVNPALEPGDIVQITRTRPSDADITELVPIVDELHVIDSLTIPLAAGTPMSGTTRATRVR